jgi:hypothetical protein
MMQVVILLVVLLAFARVENTAAFNALSVSKVQLQRRSFLSSTETSDDELVKTSNAPSADWELDCYSRPVMVDGKKLWEVLITDSSNSFRYSKVLSSNAVNSRELRKVVEGVMEMADVKPSTIRFFRGAMFNMVCFPSCYFSIRIVVLWLILTVTAPSVNVHRCHKD